MIRTTLLLAGCAAFALALGCTPKKEEAAAPAAAPDTASSSAPTSSAAAGPATAAAGQGQNAGTPVDGEATVTTPATAGVGSVIEVGWTGPGNSRDYIDLVPKGKTETSGEIGYAYTRDAIPVAKLRLPTSAGEYDVRYILDLGSERKVKATATVTVTAATATLQPPATATVGEPLSIQWTGPSGQGDYIDIVKSGVTETSGEITYAYTSAGNPAKFEAPGTAGDYDIRYLMEGPGGRKILAVSKLKIAAANATLEAPATAKKGEAFKVEWTGPKSTGDYVDLVKKGQTATSGEADYFYTGSSPSGELTAPEAGDFDIRYVLEAPGGRQILAKRSISVR